MLYSVLLAAGTTGITISGDTVAIGIATVILALLGLMWRQNNSIRLTVESLDKKFTESVSRVHERVDGTQKQLDHLQGVHDAYHEMGMTDPLCVRRRMTDFPDEQEDKTE